MISRIKSVLACHLINGNNVTLVYGQRSQAGRKDAWWIYYFSIIPREVMIYCSGVVYQCNRREGCSCLLYTILRTYRVVGSLLLRTGMVGIVVTIEWNHAASTLW